MTKPAYIREIRDPNLFQSLCQHLLQAEHPDTVLVDDASGDAGIDAYVPSIRTLYAMYCPERSPVRKESYQDKIRADLSKAVKLNRDHGYLIEHFVFLTPAPMPEELCRYLRDKVAEVGFSTGSNKSDTYLHTLFARHPGLRNEFPALCLPNIEAKLDDLSAQVGTASRSLKLHKVQAISGVMIVVIATALYFCLVYANTAQEARLKELTVREKAELQELMNLRDRYRIEKEAKLLTDLEYYKRVVEAQDKLVESNKNSAERKSLTVMYNFSGKLLLYLFPLFMLLMLAGGLLMLRGFRRWHDVEQKYATKTGGHR